MTAEARMFARTFFHGTKADLKPGDQIVVGRPSNFLETGALSWAYFTATLDAAVWGAELARGDGPGRIYVVEPVGAFEDDPNVTDKKFPGNPTFSYRSQKPLRVLGEVKGWAGHGPERVRAMQEGLARMRASGGGGIID